MDISKFLSDFSEQFEDASFEIGEFDRFREFESWDSLTGMAVLYMIERNYGVNISADDFKHLETARDIFEYIENEAK
jgi:acyl carrier protein